MIEYTIAVFIGALCGWMGAGRTKRSNLQQYLSIVAGIIGGFSGVWLSNSSGLHLYNNILKAECTSAVAAIISTELYNFILKRYLSRQGVTE